MPKRIPHTEMEIITGAQRACDYLAMQQRLGKYYLKFLDMLGNLKKTGDFLEVGSGPGYQTAKVAERNPSARIQAIEPSFDMIDVARSYIKQQGFNDRVSFTQGEVEDEGLIKGLGRFDLIYSSYSLHHWKDPLKAILNLYRALKDDGVLLIYDFERHPLTYYLPFIRKGLRESIRASYIIDEILLMMESLRLEDFLIKSSFPYLSLMITK